MPGEILIHSQKTTSKNGNQYELQILQDYKERILVRKTEIIAGIKVPLFETYVISPYGAVTQFEYLYHEIHNFQLN